MGVGAGAGGGADFWSRPDRDDSLLRFIWGACPAPLSGYRAIACFCPDPKSPPSPAHTTLAPIQPSVPG